MAHGTGWQIPSGFALANPAGPGEEGYYMHLTPKPTPEHPLRAVIRTPCSSLVCSTPDEARAWLDNPGDHPAMATHYIEWAEVGLTENTEKENTMEHCDFCETTVESVSTGGGVGICADCRGEAEVAR